MRRKLIMALMILAAAIAGCSSQRSSNDKAVPLDSASLPDSKLRGATIYHFKGGQVSTEIRADSIKEYDVSDSVLAYNLDVDFYDSTGNKSSNLIGDSGICLEGAGEVTVYGNVLLVSFDPTGKITSRLAGDSIVTLDNGEQLTVYDHVVAIREKDSLRIESDSLNWNPNVNDSFPVRTDAFVKFTSPSGTTWDGWGLRANDDLSVIRTGEGSGTVNISDTAEANR